METRQISVFLENKPGQLAVITSILADAGIDLRAISIAETEDYGILRIIVNRPDTAAALLKEKGCVCTVTRVVPVAVPDVPGGLNGVLKFIAAKHVGVDYMYSLFRRASGHAVMVFQVKDPEKFIEDFADSEFEIVKACEIGIIE